MILNNMIGGILIGHGELPKALQSTVEKFIGEQTNFTVLSNENCSAQELRTRLQAAIREFGEEAVIIFVDLVGGSCDTIARQVLSQIKNQKVAILCGVNVAVRIKYFQYRTKYKFDNLLQLLSETAKKEITTIN